MIERTKQFKYPRKNAKIWKYLDLSKFLSLISEKRLTFTRVDLLDDPFEGSYSKPSIVERENIYSDISRTEHSELSDIFKRFKAFTFVNCWHINEYESAAMWSLYLKSSEGIAIQSTYDKLDKSFEDDPNNIKIALGKINYIDYSKDKMNLNNPLFAFFYKRKSFNYENELRAAFTQIPQENGGYINLVDFDEEIGGNFDIETPLNEKIKKINTNLDNLIEKIYVSPTSEDWFMDIVKSVVDRYGLKKDVIRSDLVTDPIY